ncbi:hypothetical protein ES703_105238 [subsurface metagenome]
MPQKIGAVIASGSRNLIGFESKVSQLQEEKVFILAMVIMRGCTGLMDGLCITEKLPMNMICRRTRCIYNFLRHKTSSVYHTKWSALDQVLVYL